MAASSKLCPNKHLTASTEQNLDHYVNHSNLSNRRFDFDEGEMLPLWQEKGQYSESVLRFQGSSSIAQFQRTPQCTEYR